MLLYNHIMKKLVDLFLVLDNLSRIPRTGPVLFAGIDPNRVDSVAEHHYKVACAAYLYGSIAIEKGEIVDVGKIIIAAITHDWADGILLDVPSGSPSYRSYFGRGDELRDLIKKGECKAKKAIEKYISEEVKISFDKPLNEKETCLLKAADTTAMLIEILEWKYQGLRYEWFDYVWSNTLERFRLVVKESAKYLLPIAKELDNAYRKGYKPPNPFLTKPQYQSHKKK